jgi:hypothetical protein
MLLKKGIRFSASSVLLSCVFVAGMVACQARSEGADAPPAAPKVSTFAPAADLAVQADRYIKELEDGVAEVGDYADNKDKIALKSNTLIIISLALGLHDQDSKYKAQAGAMMKAAQAVAAAKDFESAKKTVAALKEAAEGKVKSDVKLGWEKSASLPELMKEVPLINTKLKRFVKPEKFKTKAKESGGYTAVIGAIAQGTIVDTSATKKPEDVKQWYEFMAVMRDRAGTLNAAIHKGDVPAGTEAMKKLQQSCEDCHKVFHPEAIGKEDAE